jgi:uncharacterized protein (UPF0303 family)
MNERERTALLREVVAETPQLRLSSFDLATARALGTAIAVRAERERLPVAVSVRLRDQWAFHAAFEGATAENDQWVRRKLNTSARFRISSLEVLLRSLEPGSTIGDDVDPREEAIAPGAVPLFVGDTIAGIIGVSGLVESVRADHDLVMDAIRKLSSRGHQ